MSTPSEREAHAGLGALFGRERASRLYRPGSRPRGETPGPVANASVILRRCRLDSEGLERR